MVAVDLTDGGVEIDRHRPIARAGPDRVWSAERAADVLAAYRELTESAPRELTAAAIVRLAPPAPFLPQAWHGKPIVGIQVCHSGANAAADLAPVRGLGNPIVDLVTPKPYAAVQSMLNAMEPKWLHRYWKAEFLPGLLLGDSLVGAVGSL